MRSPEGREAHPTEACSPLAPIESGLTWLAPSFRPVALCPRLSMSLPFRYGVAILFLKYASYYSIRLTIPTLFVEVNTPIGSIRLPIWVHQLFDLAVISIFSR